MDTDPRTDAQIEARIDELYAERAKAYANPAIRVYQSQAYYDWVALSSRIDQEILDLLKILGDREEERRLAEYKRSIGLFPLR